MGALTDPSHCWVSICLFYPNFSDKYLQYLVLSRVPCRFTVGMVLLLRGVDLNDHCSWCHYLSCVPTSRWSCNTEPISCQVRSHPTSLSNGARLSCNFIVLVNDKSFVELQAVSIGNEYTLTCSNNGRNSTYTLFNPSQSQIQGLCAELCR